MTGIDYLKYFISRYNQKSFFQKTSSLSALINLIEICGKKEFNQNLDVIINQTINDLYKKDKKINLHELYSLVNEAHHASYRKMDVLSEEYSKFQQVVYDLINSSFKEISMFISELCWIKYKLYLNPNLKLKNLLEDAQDEYNETK